MTAIFCRLFAIIDSVLACNANWCVSLYVDVLVSQISFKFQINCNKISQNETKLKQHLPIYSEWVRCPGTMHSINVIKLTLCMLLWLSHCFLAILIKYKRTEQLVCHLGMSHQGSVFLSHTHRHQRLSHRCKAGKACNQSYSLICNSPVYRRTCHVPLSGEHWEKCRSGTKQTENNH